MNETAYDVGDGLPRVAGRTAQFLLGIPLGVFQLIAVSARPRRIAFALLAAQTLFSVVKFTVYHESAAFVFFGITAVTAIALVMYHTES